MKNLLPFIIILITGSVYSKEIPGPFWYSISEKILTETHQLIGSEVKEGSVKTTKMKAAKNNKAVKPTLKCTHKKETILPVPYFTISTDGLWSISE